LLFAAEQAARQAPAGSTAVQLATALAMSERTLHRRLKALTGEAPKAFITRIRIETARVLLETPGTSVKAAARLSGYADEASFRRAFTLQTGLTPTAFRQWANARKALPPAKTPEMG
jgi:AraC-like DNA-binding protein